MKLPKLTLWEAIVGPPRASDLDLSNTFPQLETLGLITEEISLEWISFFGAISRHTSSSQPSSRRPVQKLSVLESLVEVPIDAAFMSPIMQFHGLAKLWLNSSCFNANGCTFNLTDDDFVDIAIALPRLRDATFGCVSRQFVSNYRLLPSFPFNPLQRFGGARNPLQHNKSSQ